MRTDQQSKIILLKMLSTRCRPSKSWAFHLWKVRGNFTGLYRNDVIGEEIVWAVRAVRQIGEQQFRETNPSVSVSALMTLIDFTLSNARRFYSSKGNPSDTKGLRTEQGLYQTLSRGIIFLPLTLEK